MAVEWNEDHDAILQRRMRYCKYKADTHWLAARAYQQWDRWLAMPSLFLQVIVSTSLWSNFDRSCGQRITWIMIVTGALATVAAGIQGVQKYFRFSHRAFHHHHISRLYARLQRDMEEQLSFRREDREPVHLFLQHLKRQLHDIEMDAEPLPESMVTQYLSSVKEHYDEETAYVMAIREREENGKDHTVVSVPPASSSSPSVRLRSTSSLQDEFTQRMDEALEEKKRTLEKYHLDRLNQSSSS